MDVLSHLISPLCCLQDQTRLSAGKMALMTRRLGFLQCHAETVPFSKESLSEDFSVSLPSCFLACKQ